MARASDAAEVRAACLSFLHDRWPRRRLRVQAASDDTVNAIAATARSWRLQRADDCPYVNFSAAPPGADAVQRFLATLSSNTRQQIGRARRRAEQSGALSLEKAATPETAASFLAEMIALHGAAWQSRKGMEGAFESPLIQRFVAHLVQTGTANGTVELLRVRAGTQTIGILLNFVFRNEAYSYQSGFAYSADNRDKPGLLCHALAAADYLARGIRGYHFMAGQNRYKQSLSNASERLSWVETYPHELVARAEDTARTLWRWLRKVRTAPPQGGAS
jgi:CelD/BcsL family acetyltransferase involved in cellulose biosynthesis